MSPEYLHNAVQDVYKRQVLHKVDQIRNDCFGSLCLQQIYQMVVGGRQEFYQDLAYP